MTVSSLGDWLGVFALTLFVQNLAHSPEFAIGGVLFFRVLPGLFFGPFAGVLTDRFDRRRLMVSADLARAALIVSIPWIQHIYALFAVSAAMEMLTLLWTPGKDATVPNLVERHQLMTANQLSLITTYGTFPLSGVLVTLLGAFAAVLARIDVSLFRVLKDQPTSLAFFVDCGTFLFSAFMVSRMPAELMRSRRARTQFGLKQGFRDLAEGMHFLKTRRSLRALVFGAWSAFAAGGAVISLGPLYARRIVGGGSAATQAAWGALITTVGLGLVGGMIFSGPLAKRFERERLFPVGLVMGGVAIVAIASMSNLTVALGVTFVAGFGAGLAWVTIFTLLQERVDDRLRGRIFATLYTGVQMSLFISLAGWPLIAAAVGNHHASIGSWRIDLSGFRVALWSGGIFFSIAGILAGRAAGAPIRPKRVARLRGLRLEPRPLSGGAPKGLFIAFEGVEGSGKTTQLKMLHDWLRSRSLRVVVTREPGGTAIAERIRGLLLDPGAKEMDSKTEALLYAASRAQHVAQIIRPALETGAVVLCDRYVDSSLAYQGVARSLGVDDVMQLNVWATDELLPDLVILLNLEADAGLARTRGNPDRIEQEGLAFHRAVGAAYLDLAKSFPSRFVVVDAANDPEKVQAEIQAAVEPLVDVLIR